MPLIYVDSFDLFTQKHKGADLSVDLRAGAKAI